MLVTRSVVHRNNRFHYLLFLYDTSEQSIVHSHAISILARE